MSLASSIHRIQRVLDASPSCHAGLAATKRAFGIEIGPSGNAEILVTLYLDDPFWGFWYGHIQQHPQKSHTYVSQIVWTEKFINARTVPLLFQRFHYWIKGRLFYQPCSIQSTEDAYCESNTLDGAAGALVRMICAFDLDRRSGLDGTGYEGSPLEMRICQIYGITPAQGGDIPSVPIATQLAVVKNPT